MTPGHEALHSTGRRAGFDAHLAFSYAVSHDLRAPLRAIDGFSLALLDEHDHQLDAEGRHCLARIRANTLRMSDLIDALLGLSRLTGGDLVGVPVDLAEIARSAAEDVRQAHPASVARISILERLPAMGDSSLLRIVLVNLIDNAVKFCAAADDPRIVIGGSIDAESVHLFVEDSGAGFDMAYANRLFAPFQRLHESSQFPGVGVGLATVHRIMARHGGRVWAEGSPDRGATFHIELPRSPA
jgi:signal transduction histidine kinase